MTDLGGITRYSCPLPDCGWQRDITPADGKWAVELAMREHCDEHSTLQYVRALSEAAKAEYAAQTVADDAWGSVWLHGKWDWLTKQMTTEQREYAADCVARWSARLNADDLDSDELEGLRWWREAA